MKRTRQEDVDRISEVDNDPAMSLGSLRANAKTTATWNFSLEGSVKDTIGDVYAGGMLVALAGLSFDSGELFAGGLSTCR